MSITIYPVEYSTVECSTYKKFEKAIITINCDFSQTLKQKTFSKSFKVSLAFPEKWFVFVDQI